MPSQAPRNVNAAPTGRQCIGIRSHRFGDAEIALYETLATHFSPSDIFLVIDESKGTVDVPAGRYQKIAFDKARLSALGLFTEHPGIGWLCGDYFIYMLRQHVDADYYWLVEPDVRFSFDDVGVFFRKFAGVSNDFTAPKFGRRNADWHWHKFSRPISEDVYGCLFPLTRTSRRAADALLEARREWNASREGAGCPNDESFVATTLMSQGFACKTMETVHPGAFAHFGVFNPYCWDHARKQLPEGQVVHPAFGEKDFWNGFQRKTLDLLQRAEKHAGVRQLLQHGAMGADAAHKEKLRSEFLAAAAQWFDKHIGSDAGGHAAETDAAGLPAMGADANSVTVNQRTILSRSKEHVAVAAAQDFELADAVSRPFSLDDLARYSPYTYLPPGRRFLLVDTPEAVREEAFFYQGQFRHATEVIGIELAKVHKLLDARPELLEQDPALVFSIGRCGSTLFSKLGGAAGMIDFSEPDVFVSSHRITEELHARRMLRASVAMLALNAQTTPDRMVIKFRSHSNTAIGNFLKVFPNARYVFLMRNLRAWSASFISKFNWSNDQLLNCLVSGAHAMDALESAGARWTLLRYEEFSRQPELVCQALVDADKLPAGLRERLSEIAGKDSQEGSGIGRKQLDKDATDARTELFLKHYEERASDAVKRRYYIDAPGA